MNVTNQTQIDHTLLQLDGTSNKSKLGANALLAISLACLKAAAVEACQGLFEHIGGKPAYKITCTTYQYLKWRSTCQQWA